MLLLVFSINGMSYPKPVKKDTIIKAVVTVLSLILVMIFAPRMEEARVIGGVSFTTKTGSPGLTNLGWLLLITVPIITFTITHFILKMFSNKNGSH